MEIVLSSLHLGILGGAETYVLTVAEQLQSLGHGVTVYTLDAGQAALLGVERGLEIVAGEEHLRETCDVVIANDSVTAYSLADRYPGAALVYVVHSDEYDLLTPPQIPEIAQAVVVLNDRVGRRMHALAHVSEVIRLRQPIDTKRFFPRTPLNDPPQRVMMLGNWMREDRRNLVVGVCRELGIECESLGFRAAASTVEPEVELGRADIVIGKARVILEAMASGRAAYVYDHNGGDGWVTPERYDVLEADNFGGQAEPTIIDADRLRRDLADYTPAMGLANRDLVVAHHSANRHAQALAELCARVVPRERQVAAPSREIGRLVRMAWSSEWRAAYWADETLKRQKQLDDNSRLELDHQTGDELDRVRSELAWARTELAWMRAELARARTELEHVNLAREQRAADAGPI